MALPDFSLPIAGQCGVYVIRNVRNGKEYVGSAFDIRARWLKHLSELARGKHHSIVLQRAWGKYGAAGFEFKVLLLCGRDSVIDYEQRCIDGLKPALNTALVAGAPMTGRTHSKVTKEKMSAAAMGHQRGLGQTASVETREKLRVVNTGRKHTPEALEKMRAVKVGNKYALGHRHTPKSLEKMRQAQLGKTASAETRDRMRLAHLKEATT